MNIIDYLKEGSDIHIKKKNKGKFTDYCGGKVTEECIARGKKSPSATIRKRATFAANARKWKHENGGILKKSEGGYINTGRTAEKNKELEKENYRQYRETLKKLSKSEDMPVEEDYDIPEEDKLKTDTDTSDNTSTAQHDESWINEFLIPTSGTETTSSTTASKNYIVSSKNENRERLRAYLKRRGLDDATIEALLVQAGAESGYNHQIKNPNSSAYGLGQWVKANHLAIIDHVNQVRNKQYTNISQLDFDDQAEALAWWYYDRNKNLLDSKQNVYDKVKTFAKIGLGPAILTNGSATFNGKTYRDTDEDWLNYFTDTGHNPSGAIKSFDDHIASRFRHAGYTI